jgi:phage shock protein PspC (stress-responsive transcriptional regulator)
MNKKRLYKSTRNKKICGVCAGIAEYLNVDPTIVRLITVLIALAWGSGVLAYIIMAFVMPDDNEIIQ